MSDKLFNKAAQRKTSDWGSLTKEYEKILLSTEAEDLIRKDEIIQLFLRNDQEDVWKLVEKEYKTLLDTRENDIALSRCHTLTSFVGKHQREFVHSGPSCWLVVYE